MLDQKSYIWSGEELGAKFDVLDEVPDGMSDIIKKYREQLVEKIAETDDRLLDKYLNGEALSNDELKTALRAAVIAYKIVPIFAGSSLRNKGVQPLLDAVVDYLPAPLDIKEVKGMNA